MAEADDKSFEEIWRHLDEPDGRITVILRGHLLTEVALERIIANRVSHPSYVAQARLSYAQKISLARAHHTGPGNPPIWEALASLNTLRNDLAHAISSTRRDERFRDFVSRCTALYPDGVSQRSFPIDQALLKALFVYVLGWLEGMQRLDQKGAS